jgi:hypothetical protein
VAARGVQHCEARARRAQHQEVERLRVQRQKRQRPELCHPALVALPPASSWEEGMEMR